VLESERSEVVENAARATNRETDEERMEEETECGVRTAGTEKLR
jgi:metal-responsive CopG/Arc/MetJ family transcriptional regulator